MGCVFRCIGRALEWHSRGQRFDPAYLHQEKIRNLMIADFFLFILTKEQYCVILCIEFRGIGTLVLLTG